MKTSLRALALMLSGLITAAPLALAHSVWIEDTSENQLVVRFGEPGETPEKSPGLLDRLAPPVAWTPGEDGKPSPFIVEKKSDHFLYVGANPAQTAFGETGFPVMGKEGKPASKPHFYLRWLPAGVTVAGTPSLTFDIVPTGEAGAFRVFFRNQPLADATVTIHAPGEKEQEAKTDAQGLLHLTASKSGLYLITANHREESTGFAAGKAYAIASHNVTLSWRQP